MARTIAKDHDEKRRLILDRAARVFASDGFHRASVARVARECGISKANIYHYYPGKDAILFDILDSHLSGLRDRVLGLDLSGQQPGERLHRTITEILLAYEGADDEHRLQAGDLAHLSPHRQAVLRGYQRDLVRHVDGLVEAVAPRVFTGDRAKLRAATMSIFGMLNWFYMWNEGADRRERLNYAGVVCTLALKGIPGL